jgi:hypothetical protein
MCVFKCPGLEFAQIAPGHFGGLVQTEQAEHGRGHVFERAAFAQFEAARGFVDEVEGTRLVVCAVCGCP